MRIVVFSDSHGSFWSMHEVIEKQPNADWYVFLGDGQDEFNEIKEMYPHKNFVGVRGNCDPFSKLPGEYMLDINGVKVFCTHGHNHYVKGGTGYIYSAAKERGATVILHGHTHEAAADYRDGIYLICPGSLSKPRKNKPSFAWVDITDKGILHNIVWLD